MSHHRGSVYPKQPEWCPQAPCLHPPFYSSPQKKILKAAEVPIGSAGSKAVSSIMDKMESLLTERTDGCTKKAWCVFIPLLLLLYVSVILVLYIIWYDLVGYLGDLGTLKHFFI